MSATGTSNWMRSASYLSREEEAELIRRWQENQDTRARDKIIESHARLVSRLLHRRFGWGARKYEDLFQEGILALMRALDRFDLEFGVRFSTYARHWVIEAFQSYLAGDRTMHISGVNARRKRGASIANLLDIDRMAETLSDPGESPEDIVARTLQDERVRRTLDLVLSGLKDRERRIVEARVLAEDRVTLDALGVEFGVSRERIRQIEEKAMLKVQRALVNVGDPR